MVLKPRTGLARLDIRVLAGANFILNPKHLGSPTLTEAGN